MVQLNLSKVSNTTLKHLDTMKERVMIVDKMIQDKSGLGNDFLGWIDYACNFDNNLFEKINEVARKIKNDCDVLLVIGIGGSYLGSKAAIDAINGCVKKSKPEILFLGNTLSPTYTSQVLDYVKDKKIAINVISKSGTTIEPAIAFRLACEVAKKCWGKKYNEYVFATTDAVKGALHQMSLKEGYQEFVIPDNVGGRFSVFTPVGLLPMAVAGIDIKDFIAGAAQGAKEYNSEKMDQNPAYKYAALRVVEKEKYNMAAEFFTTYEPHFIYLGEWWKQLYGESEGKDKKGILPVSMCFSTDLHSLGQFCQDGSPVFFQTTLQVEKYQEDVLVPSNELNYDKLNYLADKPISIVENIAIESTLKAHYEVGKHDNVVIKIEEMNAYNLGNLMYFFCKVIAMSAYLFGLNPFNQPGVEIYKANMKELLSEIK